jgi:hypothetical protein
VFTVTSVLGPRDNLGDLDENGRVISDIDLKEMGYEGVDLIHLAQDRVQW